LISAIYKDFILSFKKSLQEHNIHEIELIDISDSPYVENYYSKSNPFIKRSLVRTIRGMPFNKKDD
jgi:hypothetical protein